MAYESDIAKYVLLKATAEVLQGHQGEEPLSASAGNWQKEEAERIKNLGILQQDIKDLDKKKIKENIEKNRNDSLYNVFSYLNECGYTDNEIEEEFNNKVVSNIEKIYYRPINQFGVIKFLVNDASKRYFVESNIKESKELADSYHYKNTQIAKNCERLGYVSIETLENVMKKHFNNSNFDNFIEENIKSAKINNFIEKRKASKGIKIKLQEVLVDYETKKDLYFDNTNSIVSARDGVIEEAEDIEKYLGLRKNRTNFFEDTITNNVPSKEFANVIGLNKTRREQSRTSHNTFNIEKEI